MKENQQILIMTNYSKKKRILVVQNQIMPYRKGVYNGLAEQYDVTVLHSGKPSVGPKDKYHEQIRRLIKIGPFFFQGGLFKAIGNGGYDVLIVMFDIRWINNVIALFFSSKLRFIYWGHRHSKNPIVNKVRYFLLRKVDAVIQYSDKENKRMVAKGVAPEKIFVANNTMNISNHSNGSLLSKDAFIFVGRAQKRKRVDILLKAFAESINRIPQNVKISIIGSGKENDRLKNIAKLYNIQDRVIFHGKIDDAACLKKLFHKAYAYVSPGPVGLGVLHSFAYGIPVVTSSRGKHGPEFDNLSKGQNAVIYNCFEELKSTLVKLCRNNQWAIQLGTNAYRTYCEDRSFHKMLKSMENAIENNIES